MRPFSMFSADAFPSVDHHIIAQNRHLLGDEFSFLVSNFIAEAQSIMAAIIFIRACGDYDELQDMAHTLKSGAIHVGALRTAKHAETMELFIREGKPFSTLREESQLNRMIECIQTALHDFQENISAHL